MKEDLKRAGSILLVFIGCVISFFSIATIYKIIESGHRDKVDIELAVIMLVFTLLGIFLIYKGGKVLSMDRFFIKIFRATLHIIQTPKVFLILAACALVGIVIVEGVAAKMICMMIGTPFILYYGALKGFAFKESEKYTDYRQLRFVIGAPVGIYLVVALLLIEFLSK